MHLRTLVETEPVSENETIRSELRLRPRLPLSIRIPEGGDVLGSLQRPSAGQQISAEQDLHAGSRLRNLYRRGAQRKLEQVLRDTGAVLTEPQGAAWADWQREWEAVPSDRESVRLVVLSTLFFRVLYPALTAQTSPEGREKCEELIKLLWDAIQQFLPQGRWAENFVTIAHNAWLQRLGTSVEVRQPVLLSQIIAEMMWLPLSDARRGQLNQWVDGMMNIPVTQPHRQLFYCVILLRYLRDVAEEITETTQRHHLARHVEEIEMWIASRLAPGQSIEAFLQRCREGLIEEAAIKIVCEQLNIAFDEARQHLSRAANLAQQQTEESRGRITTAARYIETQNQAAFAQAGVIDSLGRFLQQEERALHNQLLVTQQSVARERRIQEELMRQIHRLEEEGKRL